MRKRFLIGLVAAVAAFGAEPGEVTALDPSVAYNRAARPHAVQQQQFEFVFPELILGGEWTSVIKLVNRGTGAIPTTNVFFVDNVGNPLNAAFITSAGNITTGPGFSFSLQAGGMIEIPFVGGSNSQFGQAIVDLCHSSPCVSGLYGEVLLRNRNATRPDFESMFPLEQPSSLQYMLFDHRAGVQTVLYLCSDITSATTVTLTFVDQRNNTITRLAVPLAAEESKILNLNVEAPATNGLLGVITISTPNSNALVTATALRINPSNSFTPLRAFQPHQ